MNIYISSAKKQFGLILLLIVCVLVTSIGVVYTKHLNRKYFSELRELSKKKDEMNIEWGQLQLEQSTFATSSEIENKSSNKLDMHQPTKDETIIVRL